MDDRVLDELLSERVDELSGRFTMLPHSPITISLTVTKWEVKQNPRRTFQLMTTNQTIDVSKIDKLLFIHSHSFSLALLCRCNYRYYNFLFGLVASRHYFRFAHQTLFVQFNYHCCPDALFTLLRKIPFAV
jgi:hypothetical protein